MASPKSQHASYIVASPAGICDACGKQCCTLNQVGIACYHCQAGKFAHRGAWVFWDCPACHGRSQLCPACYGYGWIAMPGE